MHEPYKRQLERAQRTKKSHSYFLLCRGPAEHPCPVHSMDWGLVLHIDDDYWISFPMKEHPGCKCNVRHISNRDYERIKREGIQDPYAPAIYNEDGYNTGHRVQRKVPIKEAPHNKSVVAT